MNFLNVIKFGEIMEYPSLFEGIPLPNGLDLNVLIDKIVYDNWDLEPMISDYMLLQKMINNFFNTKLNVYTRLYNALTEEYNAIHNYDRYEDRNENRNLKKTDVLSSKFESTDEDTVSAYNSSTYQPRNKNDGTSKTDDTRNVNDDETYVTKNHLYGNIGVTTTQKMLESEIKLRIEYNIYSLISLDFRREFMLLSM